MTTSDPPGILPRSNGPALDWSGRDGAPLATVGPTAPCVHCGTPALLRHPATARPCHKACAEARTADSTSTLDGAR